jgi:nitrogen fixation protein
MIQLITAGLNCFLAKKNLNVNIMVENNRPLSGNAVLNFLKY